MLGVINILLAQETGNNFRKVFALSNRPCFHSAYGIRGYIFFGWMFTLLLNSKTLFIINSNVYIFFVFAANATRECFLDGGWADKAVYDNCKPKQDITDTTCDNSSNPYLCIDYSMMIYSIGYTLSLVSLIIALIILLSLRWEIHIFYCILLFGLTHKIDFGELHDKLKSRFSVWKNI